MRRIVSIWFPHFPVERFLRGPMKTAKSQLPKGLPFALLETGPKGLRLVAINAAAQNLGLSPGQRLADARAAVPDLLSEQHEPEHDRASLLGLCHWMERYSPSVALDPPDGLLLDVTGIPHLFGGEAKLLARMHQRLAEHGFTARIAIAETIGAAWAFARYAPAICAREESPKLEELCVEALRIDADVARTLRRLGLKTIGSLLAIPRASLARRFRGESVSGNVLRRLDEATGRRDEPLNPLNPAPPFLAHRAFMEPVITHQGLDVALTGLVTALSRDLEKNLQGLTRLNLKLFRSDGSCTSLSVGFSAPSYEPAHVLRLLKPKLETIDAGFGIDAMTLEARETAAVIVQQYGFMENGNSSSLDQLNDRVMNRHEGAIAALQAMESHSPERAEIPEPSPMRSGRPLPMGEGGTNALFSFLPALSMPRSSLKCRMAHPCASPGGA
jgi:protein ImuB